MEAGSSCARSQVRASLFHALLEQPCQARGVRVVGYLASGPTGAAILVLRQQVLITAKLRGRHSIFLFGVIAASPCCTWYTGRLAEVRPSYRPSAPPKSYLLSPKAGILSLCQIICVLSRWPWHAALSASAPVSTCSYEQWPLCAPATATPLLTHSAGCSVPTQELGICLPGVCAFGHLPQSALSGSRLSIASIYSHELQITPEQGPSRHLGLSCWALYDWPHSWELTLQLHAHVEGAARFLSPSRTVRLSSHLSHSASANFGIITLCQAYQGPDTTHRSTPSPAKSCSDIQGLGTYHCLDNPPSILVGFSTLLPWVVRTIGQMALGAEPVGNWQPGPRRRPGVSRKQLLLLLLMLLLRRPPQRRPSLILSGRLR